MKKIWLLLSLVVFLFGVGGCEEDDGEPKVTPPELTTLFNTKWKLVGFFDIEKDTLIEVEPKDCDSCYTLEFMGDSIHTINPYGLGEKKCYTARASMIGVGMLIYYTIDYQNSSFNVEYVLRVLKIDYLDGERFASGLYADKFELKDNELKLYYTDEWDDEGQWPSNTSGGPKKPFYLLLKRSDL